MTFETLKSLVRPAISALNGVAVAIAVFVPYVTYDKMTVAALLWGGTAYLRSQDLRKGTPP